MAFACHMDLTGNTPGFYSVSGLSERINAWEKTLKRLLWSESQIISHVRKNTFSPLIFA